MYLETYGIDCYKRTLATIYKEEGSKLINVNEWMVVRGHAWVYRQYYNHLPKVSRDELDKLERLARDRRAGLWKDENPIPPWEWESRKCA